MKRKQKIEAGCIGVLGAWMVFAACTQDISLGEEYYSIYLNNRKIGSVSAKTDTEKLIHQAKRRLMQQNEGYVYLTADVDVKTEDKPFIKMRPVAEMETELAEGLKACLLDGKVSAYTIATAGYSANFADKAQAEEFLEKVKNHTEGGENFAVSLDEHDVHEDAYKACMVKKMENKGVLAGISSALMEMTQNAKADKNYQEQTGILAMDFADTVYGYDNMVAPDSLADIETETVEVTKEKESNTIYVVEAGDCLSIIAEKFDTTIDSIVRLNELANEEAVVYLDQELIVAVPRPDITLRVSEGVVYEEPYEEKEQVIENDGWYTTRKVVHQEGQAGQRRVNDIVTSENGIEIARETVHTEILQEAVPSIVEQGTIIPPSYIKPMGGGRFTSGFGRRWGRMHKGVDWAVSIGTNVYASSAGTVSVAGSVSGYGYAVYINHPDGRQTRYGHLSKVLVSPGQSVEQGQTIALSGNTGRSTGPHLHFEILINGSQVNPLDYIR